MIVPLLLALSPLQATSELLPPLREGWRFERLDLPLSFAPTLDYQGFEELQFAPGMFDPESASHFSYALCIRIEGRSEVDARFLRHFFTEYFRGLCDAVGQSRGLELDLSQIAVALEDNGTSPRRDITVEMLDAFAGGDRLVLHIELERRARDGFVELLGLVSPAPRDASIWRELRTIRDGWWKKQTLPVFLNHVYFVPDAETYEAIKASDFMTDELGPWEERTTVRKDISYTGIYFYGQNTYFEFLHPDSGFPVGSAGIGFGVEGEGQTGLVAEALEQLEIASFPRPVTREHDGQQVPWFEMLGIQQASQTAKLSLFTLEYEPSFLADWHGSLAPSTRGITRQEILERYAAKLGQTRLRSGRLLDDVVTLSADIDAAERDQILKICGAFEYSVDVRTGTGFMATTEWRCDGPGFRLYFDRPHSSAAAERALGLTGIGLSLTRPVDREPLHLGKMTVVFEGASAWIELGH